MLNNSLYVLNKEDKQNKFKEILENLLENQDLILIKDNETNEFLDLIKNQKNMEEVKIEYYDNTIKNLLILDYEHISLKTKIKIICIKEDFSNEHIFRDLEAYIRDNQNRKRETKSIKKMTVILNNYNVESKVLEKLLSVSKSYNLNFILLNEETNNLNDIILSNVEKY